MLKFAKLSNLLKPDYCCPSCRDLLLPSLRNSFLDFKLTASLNTLNTLISYMPSDGQEWKLAGVDMLNFLNSQFFRRRSTSISANDAFIESDNMDIIEIDEDPDFFIDSD